MIKSEEYQQRSTPSIAALAEAMGFRWDGVKFVRRQMGEVSGVEIKTKRTYTRRSQVSKGFYRRNSILPRSAYAAIRELGVGEIVNISSYKPKNVSNSRAKGVLSSAIYRFSKDTGRKYQMATVGYDVIVTRTV